MTTAQERLFRHRRLKAASLAVLTVALILFSVLFLSGEADHVCRGEGCPVCACMRRCEDSLRKLGASLPALAALLIRFLVGPAPVRRFSYLFLPSTLISRRVRIND